MVEDTMAHEGIVNLTPLVFLFTLHSATVPLLLAACLCCGMWSRVEVCTCIDRSHWPTFSILDENFLE
jgi:hypothetical protein